MEKLICVCNFEYAKIMFCHDANHNLRWDIVTVKIVNIVSLSVMCILCFFLHNFHNITSGITWSYEELNSLVF